MSRHPYSSVVDYLMYAMFRSRPGLSHTLCIVTRSWLMLVMSLRVVQQIFICEVLPMPICKLENLEMDLLVMLILIMLMIWIRGCLS
jgi:hypothetical protein